METTSIGLRKEPAEKSTVISPPQLLTHWQGHRGVTRRVIEAFPERELFNYAIGGMRPFAQLAMEMISMAVPGLKGVITGEWDNAADTFGKASPPTKNELLSLWDETTKKINKLWPEIPPHRFQEIDVAFGQYKGPLYFTVFYWIDKFDN